MTERVSWLDGAGETVRKLLTEMADDPSGAFEPSVYETGRIVARTPSLAGHERRVRYLLDTQAADGRWGGPGAYDIVPTLSATGALLAERDRPGAPATVRRAAERGVRALRTRLGPDTPLPDTVAVEILVPALVAELDVHLARDGADPLPMPEAGRPDLLDTLRTAVAEGHVLPEKLWHSLEILGDGVRGASSVEPVGGRVVGCSPAATAAWLGDEGVRDADHPCVGYLRSVQSPDGGMPVAAPLTLFERSWVLSTLIDSGVPLTAPRPVLDTLVESLHAAFGPEGAAGGPGLPPDVDDTGTALHALALLGSPRPAASLWHYEVGDHFTCFPEERTPSTTANAHVLQALGSALTPPVPGGTDPGAADPGAADPGADRARLATAADTVTRWLCARQHPDGSWSDKWHASPYYAIVCCATALADHGGPAARSAVRAAVDRVLTTQRPDGTWGHWFGTREETAYAVRTLLRAGDPGNEAVARAAARGATHLLDSADGPACPDGTGPAAHRTGHPALWHDKDVYTPTRIVDTEIFAALYLAHTDRRTARLLADTTRVGTGAT